MVIVNTENRKLLACLFSNKGKSNGQKKTTKNLSFIICLPADNLPSKAKPTIYEKRGRNRKENNHFVKLYLVVKEVLVEAFVFRVFCAVRVIACGDLQLHNSTQNRPENKHREFDICCPIRVDVCEIADRFDGDFFKLSSSKRVDGENDRKCSSE